MRLRIYILMIAALLVCSCARSLSEDRLQETECIALTVFNTSMGTKAGEVVYEHEGEAGERLLKRLDIFLYPKGRTNESCVFHKHLSGLNDVGSSTVPVYVSEEVSDLLFKDDAVQCDVFVLANMPSDMTFDGDETVKELSDMSVISKEFSEVVASDGSFVMPGGFVMTGLGVAEKSGDSIGGTIPLERAACKVTMNLNIPEFLEVKALNASDQTEVTEIWHPYFIDKDPTKGIHTMHMGYHKGLGKTLVKGVNQRLLEDTFETLYSEDFEYVKTITIEKDGKTKSYYQYRCEVSFYSYAFSWEGEENDVQAPYFTIMIPWKRDVDERYTTYYYQIVVNGNSQKMERNYWYDITLNVGVLGSRTYNEPTELTDMSCYVLDWSEGDRGLNEDVNLNEWRYLVIPETYIEMHNTPLGELPFEASHNIAWTLEWPGSLDGLDALEKYNESNGFSAYYINCRGKKPVSVNLSSVSNSSFAISSSGETLNLTHEIPENVYTPIYFHLKVWLDMNSNKILDADEMSFVERVTFVQYPPIYIVPDQSVAHSIFVNGINSRQSGSADANDIKYNGSAYNLGRIPGTSDSGDHMYVLNVSSFKADDTFERYGENYHYLIGDPRVRTSDTDLNNDNYVMDQHWATALDVNGVSRKLQYYYPTATQGDVYRVIAPKVRIVSFLSSGHSKITPEGAAMRCASFQEHGFPAGRWRLPTFAEIRFIISLQQKEVIQDIFYGTNYYYSSTDQVQNNNGVINYRAVQDGLVGSVRCVYDEWYWGSEREARPGTQDGGYQFTWGDRQR